MSGCYVNYTATDDVTGDSQTLRAVCVDEIAARNIIHDMVEKHKNGGDYAGFSYALTLEKDDQIIHRETNAQ